MSEIKFKTTINCSNCVRSVSGFLNELSEIEHWEVDTDVADKILTVKGTNITPEQVVNAVEDAGFDIEPLASHQ
jgi:copper chaperone